MQRIFVGDVQGCADELEELLERAQQHFGNEFELWVVGDLVNRGPDNLRALRRVRELVEASRAHYVLGNHEMGLISTALGVRELAPLDSIGDVLDAPDASEWINWLRERPLVVASQLGAQPFVMLHASAHPEWSRAELCAHAHEAALRLRGDDEELRHWLREGSDADRDVLARTTRCRSVGPDGSWSSDPIAAGHVPWHEAWSSNGPDFGVVYGHWAKQGLHVAPMLRGLDTGCVHHGRGRDGMLTAWLPDPASEQPFALPDDRFWQIPARRAYYARRDRLGARN